MAKRICVALLAFGIFVIVSPAFACGGLIGPNGAVNLTRTTTLSAYHDGQEHYITAFNYAGGGGEFGSIVPLPAMPSKVEKGGAWTLQRLLRETRPQQASFNVAAASGSSDKRAEEVYKTRIDALDITVLKGGGEEVGLWAADHGFRLPPDAPEVLDFYGDRSPYFLAAVFDSEAAEERGQDIGDGTPIHITIPLRSPWVPLRILALGKQPTEQVEADVYLLTDHVPALLPAAGPLYQVERQVPASNALLEDLRTDRGMGWLPTSGMTLTHLIVNAPASEVRNDLAINAYGAAPSRMRAGLPPLPKPTPVPTIAPTPQATTELPDLAIEPIAKQRAVWPFALATLLAAIGAAAAWALRRQTKA